MACVRLEAVGRLPPIILTGVPGRMWFSREAAERGLPAAAAGAAANARVPSASAPAKMPPDTAAARELLRTRFLTFLLITPAASGGGAVNRAWDLPLQPGASSRGNLQETTNRSHQPPDGARGQASFQPPRGYPLPSAMPGARATRGVFPDTWQQGPATSFGTSTEEETCPHEATSPTATYPDASADSTYMTVRLPGWLTVDKLILVLTNERPAFQMPGITHITLLTIPNNAQALRTTHRQTGDDGSAGHPFCLCTKDARELDWRSAGPA